MTGSSQAGPESPKAFVIGWPIKHSRSPMIHNYWLDRYGIDGRYEKVPVRPEDLAAFLAGLGPSGYVGGNVTIPHKEAIFGFVSQTEQSAKRLHAVNTLFFRDGQLVGSNTDGYGFIENLRACVTGWSAETGPAVVLGAGGAARAVIATLADAGAPEIRIVNRSLDRAEALAAELCPDARVFPWDDRAAALRSAHLLVNTTSLGMAGMPPLEIDLDGLSPSGIVSDIVYVPLRTDLLRKAAERGFRTVDGLGMLLYQAIPGFKAWFGVEPEIDRVLRRRLEDDIERSQ